MRTANLRNQRERKGEAMEDRKSYFDDEEANVVVRDDEAAQWSAAPDGEVPFEIPRD